MTSTSGNFPGQAFEPRGNPPSAAAGVPSSAEFTTAWIAYGCYFVGVLLWWPSIVGLIISYVRRNEPDAGFISTHYGWLIRTFWWSTLWWLTSFGLLVSGALPIVRDVLRSAKLEGRTLGEIEVDSLISIEWNSIFAAAGLATAGGLAMLATYLWLLYRLIRGALRLGGGRPSP